MTTARGDQQKLSQASGTIEQIEGRVWFRDSSTTYSTITLTFIASAAAPAPARQPSVRERRGLAGAVTTVGQSFANVVSGMIIVLGFILAFLVLRGLCALAWQVMPRATARSSRPERRPRGQTAD